MGALLNLFPLSLSVPLRVRQPFVSPLQPHVSKPILSPRRSSDAQKSSRFRNKIIVGCNSRDSKESQFLDENGVVDDMDGYLNYLSLEYDSVWDTKPSWCQPWTITLTGVLAIAFSWLILQSLVLTALVSLLICTWWYLFLYSYPKAYTEMIAERRRRVTNGVEDTFGVKKSQ